MLPSPGNQSEAIGLMAAGFALLGILLIPSLVHSWTTLRGKPKSWQFPWSIVRWGWLAYSASLLGGSLSSSLDLGGSWLLPIIHVLANGSMFVVLVSLIFQERPAFSPQRFWGVFNSGLLFAPIASIAVEMFALLGVGLLWGLYFTQQPDQFNEFLALANRLPQSISSPAVLERVINKYLFRPGILWTVFGYTGVLIPILEEIIKPIGVWLLAGRNLTPQQGLLLGMLSGAGYGIFENITLGSNSDAWVFISITRLGTTLIHVFTSGLVGWGLASAWQNKQHLRLGFAYLSAVLLHGTWNNLTLLHTFAQYAEAREVFGSLVYQSAKMVPAGLSILSLGSFIGILLSNILSRRAIITREK
jgi:hypothetical protein